MLLQNIELKPERLLIQPTQEASSSFSTESKKYDRKAIGVVKNVSEHSIYEIGEKVIYDDSDSIDFTIDGVSLSVISEYDIVATIKGDK